MANRRNKSDPVSRSENMRRIKNTDTSPELVLRRLLHRSGLRYRVCDSTLPGTPDIVFPRYRTTVFVHGCFWHQHERCARATLPKTRRDYWLPKLMRNKVRDRIVARALLRSGWRVLVIWECEIKRSPTEAKESVTSFLTARAGPGKVSAHKFKKQRSLHPTRTKLDRP